MTSAQRLSIRSKDFALHVISWALKEFAQEHMKMVHAIFTPHRIPAAIIGR